MKQTATRSKTTVTKKERVATPENISNTAVSQEQILERAYLIWQRKGCTHGFDIEDWFTAERELQEEILMTDSE